LGWCCSNKRDSNINSNFHFDFCGLNSIYLSMWLLSN
jgi:hypothetical protein